MLALVRTWFGLAVYMARGRKTPVSAARLRTLHGRRRRTLCGIKLLLPTADIRPSASADRPSISSIGLWRCGAAARLSWAAAPRRRLAQLLHGGVRAAGGGRRWPWWRSRCAAARTQLRAERHPPLIQRRRRCANTHCWRLTLRAVVGDRLRATVVRPFAPPHPLALLMHAPMHPAHLPYASAPPLRMTPPRRRRARLRPSTRRWPPRPGASAPASPAPSPRPSAQPLRRPHPQQPRHSPPVARRTACRPQRRRCWPRTWRA